MTTVLLVRHGRTAANAGGVLAGRSPGVVLDDVGQSQAQAVGRRLAGLPLARVVSSPLERTVQTAECLRAAQSRVSEIDLDMRVAECEYGDWTGKPLKELAKDPLWKTVQAHPSAVTFPSGEAMVAMQARALESIRQWNATVGEGMYAVVSHGDVIKSIVADALGLHLDQFQRIIIDPCSVSVIHYTPTRPFVIHVNDSGSDLTPLVPTKTKRRRRSSDAAVGGGDGSRP